MAMTRRQTEIRSSVKILKDAFLEMVRPKILQMGFIPSVFRNAFFGSDDQGGFQYDFIRIDGRILEVLRAHVFAQGNEIGLRYQQFDLSPEILVPADLPKLDSVVIFNPITAREILPFAPFWSRLAMLVPSRYSTSSLFSLGGEDIEKDAKRAAARLVKDLEDFPKLKSYWEANRKRFIIDQTGSVRIKS
jgi:hypothetical protein